MNSISWGKFILVLLWIAYFSDYGAFNTAFGFQCLDGPESELIEAFNEPFEVDKNYIKDRELQKSLWHWSFTAADVKHTEERYKRFLKILLEEHSEVQNLLHSLEKDVAYIETRYCLAKKIITQFLNRKDLADNTKAFLKIVLSKTVSKEVKDQFKLGITIYGKYLEALADTIERVEALYEAKKVLDFEQLTTLIIENLYDKQRFKHAWSYHLFSQKGARTYGTIEIDGVSLNKIQLKDRNAIADQVKFFDSYNLYDTNVDFPIFQPIQLKGSKKTPEVIAGLIKESPSTYEEDNEFRSLRASVMGKRGSLSVVVDIELIDRLLWNSKAMRPLEIQFGKKPWQKFGFDEKNFVYRADVSFAQCSEDWNNPFNLRSHPCINHSGFEPDDFKEELGAL